MNLISLFISNLVTNNLLLTKYMGLNILIEKRNAIKISILTTLIAISSIDLYYLVYNEFIMKSDLLFLFRTIIFVLIIVIMTKLFEMIIKKVSPVNYKIYDKERALIFISLLIMSFILFNEVMGLNILDMAAYLMTSSLAYVLTTYIYLSLVERFRQCDDIPKSFVGIPLAFVSLGIMYLILIRYI